MWKKYNEQKNVVIAQAGIEISDEEEKYIGRQTEERLKIELAHKITEQIIKNRLFDYYKVVDGLFPRSTKHRMEVRIVKGDVDNVVFSKYYYEVDGIKVSHEEIEQAVREQYPEKFL